MNPFPERILCPWERYGCRGVVSLLEMLRFYADKYAVITRILISLSDSLSSKEGRDKSVSTLNKTFILQNLQECSIFLEEIGLSICTKHAKEIIDAVQQDKSCEVVGGEVFQLFRNFCRELEGSIFYHIPSEQAKYSDPSEPLFGLNVYEKFPMAIVDIEESGKCLAFGRGTACVFHLMRVMEVGLRSLGKGLEIPYAPSWESYLKQINTKMETAHSKKTRVWKKNEAFYRDAAGDLQMVKLAWRNPTMHITRTYSVEEADDVFRAVRAFMKHLSTKFDQSGWIKSKR
jgi:hypothetical protein